MAKTPELDLRENYGKNYIINGDMRLAQRGTSFASIANGAYFLDRYQYLKVGSAVHTASQDTDVPTVAQSGYLHQNSLRLNVTTAQASLAASDQFTFFQKIEGYNWTNLAQKPFTLSFWVKSSTTGTYCVAVKNSIADKSYVAEYTVNTANTWEYKTITIAASPAAGTWNYTNGIGVYVLWVVASGSTWHTTPGTWQTGNFQSTTNQVNGVSTIGADFRIAGAMINEGSQAQPFRLFSSGSLQSELAACQRYYQVLPVIPGIGENATMVQLALTFPIEMRTTPALTNLGGGVLQVTDAVAADFNQSSFSVTLSNVTSRGGRFRLSNFSGITTNRPYFLEIDGPSIAAFDAEL